MHEKKLQRPLTISDCKPKTLRRATFVPVSYKRGHRCIVTMCVESVSLNVLNLEKPYLPKLRTENSNHNHTLSSKLPSSAAISLRSDPPACSPQIWRAIPALQTNGSSLHRQRPRFRSNQAFQQLVTRCQSWGRLPCYLSLEHTTSLLVRPNKQASTG
jgi:hypothetical protein